MPERYGLIGRRLSHSFSPGYFTEKFEREGIEARYDLFELNDIQEFHHLPLNELSGLNVTIPYKEAIIPLLDELDLVSERIGAVNCIEFNENGLIGHNTDVIGFRESLRPVLRRQHERALILGTGGAAKAVKYVLDELNIDHLSVSRNPAGDEVSYDQLNAAAMDQFKFIINTTPLGMYPDIQSVPSIPYEAMGPEHLVYDLIYNPSVTELMRRCQEYGAMTVNGMKMLIHQAEAGWSIWQQGR